MENIYRKIRAKFFKLNSNSELPIDVPREEPFSWLNITNDISISVLMAFCSLFFIGELHESFNAKERYGTSFINIVEIIFLLIVFVLMGKHLMFYRWNRNCWYPIPFDNNPMLFSQFSVCCVIEIVFFINNLIFIYFGCFRYYWETCLYLLVQCAFMLCLLPFLVISVKFNVRKGNNWIKLKTKFIILLSMVACLMVSSRKVSDEFELKSNQTILPDYCSPKYINNFYNSSSLTINILQVIWINYFITAFILLIKPLLNLGRDESRENSLEDNVESQTPFSFFDWLSLLRFRWMPSLLSVIMFFVLSAVLYMLIFKSPNFPSYMTTNIKIVFYSLFSFTYLIMTIFGIFYYYVDIRTWDLNDNQDLKSDQYFNFITTAAQLVFNVAVLSMNNFYPFDVDHIFKFIFYLLLFPQIMIQAKCIDSASRRKIKKFTIEDINTWKFKLVPSMIIATFNLIMMVTNISYAPTIQLGKEGKFGVLIQYITLPLMVLNRFHGLTFFINVAIKQRMIYV